MGWRQKPLLCQECNPVAEANIWNDAMLLKYIGADWTLKCFGLGRYYEFFRFAPKLYLIFWRKKKSYTRRFQ